MRSLSKKIGETKTFWVRLPGYGGGSIAMKMPITYYGGRRGVVEIFFHG
jgi:hypothetical protein